MYGRNIFFIALISVECTVKTEQQAVWVNWAGNQRYSPERIFYPQSRTELQKIVQKSLKEKKSIKAYGASHSWSDIIVDADYLVSLQKLNKILSVDTKNLLVTVEAGIDLHELNQRLARRGYALPNQPSVAVQTIAGAFSTATHGSGKTGTLASFVKEVQIIAGDGKFYTVSAQSNPQWFAALRVSLGTLGIIYAVTLICEPLFFLSEHTRTLSRDEFIKRYQELDAEFDYFLCNWNAYTDDVVVTGWKRERTQTKQNIPSFRALSSPHAGGKRLEEEIGIDLKYLSQALADLKKLFAQYRNSALTAGDVLLRFTVADRQAYLSTALGRKTTYISISVPVTSNYVPFYKDFENLMFKYKGRPHWGKINFLDYQRVRKLYGKNLDMFRKVKKELDPQGVFSSPFSKRVLKV